MQLNEEQLSKMNFSNVTSKCSTGKSCDPKTDISDLSKKLTLLEKRASHLQTTKVSTSDLLHSDLKFGGSVDFLKEPKIGKERLSALISSNSNVSRMDLPDFGRKWNKKISQNNWNSFDFENIDCKGKYQIVYEDDDGYLYISKNFGNDFTRINKKGNWQDAKISKDGQFIIAIDSDSDYIVSNDGGTTWTDEDKIEMDCDDIELGMNSDASMISVSTHDYNYNNDPRETNKIHISVNQGSSFDHYNIDNEVSHIQVTDDNTVYFSTRRGEIYRKLSTEDQFTQIKQGLPEIYKFSFYGDNVCIITDDEEYNGESHGLNTFWWSTTGIENLQGKTFDQNLNDMSTTDGGNTIIVTLRYGAAYISNDAGESFTEIVDLPKVDGDENENEVSYYVSMSDDGYVLVVGSNGQIYNSSNKGVNFTSNISLYGNSDRDNFRGMYELEQESINCIKYASGKGFACINGNLFVTKDSGSTWRFVTTTAFILTGLYDGDISSDGTVMVISGSRNIILSRDSGVTWKIIKNDRNVYVGVALSADKSVIMSIDKDFKLYRTDNDGIYWSQDMGLYIPYSSTAKVGGFTYYRDEVSGVYTDYVIVHAIKNEQENSSYVADIVGYIFGGEYLVASVSQISVNSYEYSVKKYTPTKPQKVAGDDSGEGYYLEFYAFFGNKINKFSYSLDQPHDMHEEQGGTMPYNGYVTALEITSTGGFYTSSDSSYKGRISGFDANGPIWISNNIDLDDNFVSISGEENVFFAIAGDGEIYNSSNGGQTWNTNALSNQFMNSFSPSGSLSMSSDGKYRLFTSPGFASSVSVNGGKSWFFVDELEYDDFPLASAVSDTGKYMYFATADFDNNSRLYRSNNCGKTWVKTDNYPESVVPVSLKCSADGKYVTIVLVTGIVLVSHDFGATFHPTNINHMFTKRKTCECSCEEEQRIFPASFLMSESGHMQKLFTLDGIQITSYDAGKNWEISNRVEANILYAAASKNGKFITLSCVSEESVDTIEEILAISVAEQVSRLRSDKFRILVSDDYGETFRVPNGGINFSKPIYNIAINGNGQYQVSVSMGSVFASNDYGNSFFEVSKNQLFLTQFISNLIINDSGTTIAALTILGDIYESKCCELGMNNMYLVSDVQKSDFPILGDRQANNSFDIYQVDTTDLEQDVNLHISLPKISKMYPTSTRVILVQDVGGNLSNNSIVLDAAPTDSIISVGFNRVTSLECSTNYDQIELRSNGVDTWFIVTSNVIT